MANLLRNPGVVPALWLALVVAGAGPTLAGGTVGNSLLSKDLCATLIAQAERRHGIPARLLRAISLAETGRVDPHSKAMIAWPWAVNAGGKGRFYPTKAMAMAAVRQLRAKGARNIDVGCMQVNLMHHPQAFPNLKAAFDPRRNVAYAARFLKALHAKTGSWIDAVAAYHSRLAQRGTPYMLRVIRIWVDRRARPTQLAARNPRSPAKAGAIAPRRKAKSTAKPRTKSASLVRRATARSPEAAKRRWAKVVARRKRFAEWLAQRQIQRRNGELRGQSAGAGNPG